MSEKELFLWVEKYRPKTVEDCIIPEKQKVMFQQFIEKGQIPTMLLSGKSGVGKTTIARAICEQLNCDYIIINGSEENGIDVLRTKIKSFASSFSYEGKPRVVIIDEADYLNPNSIQPALRAFIEEFNQNCRFIFTCNYKNRIIEPLHSRSTVIDFNLTKADKPVMAGKFLKRLKVILSQENVTFDEKVLVEIIKRFFPDYRRILNEVQRYSVNGHIDSGILGSNEEYFIQTLMDILKRKNWTEMRQWVAENQDVDYSTLFRRIFDNAHCAKKNDIPKLVLTLADYQYKSAFVADQEINMVACLTDIMSMVDFE